ncbi:MAG TPA: hypothetical protein VFB84_11270 [Micromonosporaceae bacterium]|nr:hypothetical protein [Micromonosporaceae bacterium]
MTPDHAAACAKRGVNKLGGAFGTCPKTLRRARELGLTGWAFYIAGRGGALGDVRSDTVAAALGFIAPDAVRDGWEAARRVGRPDQIAAHSLAECCRWGREKLTGVPGLGRLVELAERTALAADPTGLPLFAAWRAMPVPDDAPPAQAAVLLHLLREHRGGAHLMAVRAAGLTPVEAIVAGPDGEAGAISFGWPAPYPVRTPLLRRRVWAEALTDRIAGAAFQALDVPERGEFVSLLDAAMLAVQEPTGELPAVTG